MHGENSMTDRLLNELQSLRKQLDDLTREVRDLRARVSDLEAERAVAASPAATATHAYVGGAPPPSTIYQPSDHHPPQPVLREIGPAAESIPPSEEAAVLPPPPVPELIASGALFRFVTLAGRTLIVLGGAFLLRALTDAGFLPSAFGIAAGLLYAAIWLVMALRAPLPEERTSASFHGFAAAVIAYPLIVETTIRFHSMQTDVALPLILIFFAAGTGISLRRNLQAIGWISVLFAVIACMALAAGARDLLYPSIALAVMVAFLEWAAPHGSWTFLRWPAAIGLNTELLLVVAIAGREQGLPEGYRALNFPAIFAVASGIITVHFVGAIIRAAKKMEPRTVYGVLQLIGCLTVIGALTAQFGHRYVTACRAAGLLLLLLGAVCYLFGYFAVGQRPGKETHCLYLTSSGAILILMGTRIFLGSQVLAIGCFVAAVILAALSVNRGREIMLKFHAAACLAVGAAASDAIVYAGEGIFGSPGAAWHPLAPLSIMGGVSFLACYVILIAKHRGPEMRADELIADTITAALAGWMVAGAACRGLAAAIGGGGAAAAAVAGGHTLPDASAIAAVRTAVLAVLAIVMAWSARRFSLRELGWLVYPVLLLGAVKLLFEDLPNGRPVTLFVALAFYGSALFAAPRLLHHRHAVQPRRHGDKAADEIISS